MPESNQRTAADSDWCTLFHNDLVYQQVCRTSCVQSEDGIKDIPATYTKSTESKFVPFELKRRCENTQAKCKQIFTQFNLGTKCKWLSLRGRVHVSIGQDAKWAQTLTYAEGIA
jgi:hypothetical protein